MTETTTTQAPTDSELLALNVGEVHFSESPSKYPEAGHGTQYHAGAPGVLAFARAVLAKWGAPSLTNDLQPCGHSHPHQDQDLHCQLREVSAWLRRSATTGKAPSAQTIHAQADQIDGVALAMCSMLERMPEPAATVYTMEALVPGGEPKCHVTLAQPLPANTRLYTVSQMQGVIVSAHMARRDAQQQLAELQAKMARGPSQGWIQRLLTALKGGGK